jgi:hypothetical protein
MHFLLSGFGSWHFEAELVLLAVLNRQAATAERRAEGHRVVRVRPCAGAGRHRLQVGRDSSW